MSASDIPAKAEGEGAAVWHRADSDRQVMLYTLRQDGWRKGQPVMVNDVTVTICAASRSETPIEPVAQTINAALSASPQVPAVAGDEAIGIVWRSAMTVACNIAIDEQNRANEDDAASAILEAQGEIIRRIKGVLEIDDDYLELVQAMLPTPTADQSGRVPDEIAQEFSDGVREKQDARAAMKPTPAPVDMRQLLVGSADQSGLIGALVEALEPFAAIGLDYPTGGLSADIHHNAKFLMRRIQASDFYRAAKVIRKHRQALAAHAASIGEGK